MTMRDVMIDCETLGRGPDAMVLQVAMVPFNPLAGMVAAPIDCHSWTFDLDGKMTGSVDPSTVKWWSEQAPGALDAVFRPAVPVAEVKGVREIHGCIIRWARELAAAEMAELRFWSRGPDDRIWLESLFRRHGVAVPWAFWQWRDQREFCRPWQHLVDLDDMPENCRPHVALDDCIVQCWWVSQVAKLTAKVGAKL